VGRIVAVAGVGAGEAPVSTLTGLASAVRVS
jgi:hypothetical protein